MTTKPNIYPTASHMTTKPNIYIYQTASHMTTNPTYNYISGCQPHDYKAQHIYMTTSHMTTKHKAQHNIRLPINPYIIYQTASHTTTKSNIISDCQSHDHKAQHIYQTASHMTTKPNIYIRLPATRLYKAKHASHTTTKSNIISDCQSHDHKAQYISDCQPHDYKAQHKNYIRLPVT